MNETNVKIGRFVVDIETATKIKNYLNISNKIKAIKVLKEHLIGEFPILELKDAIEKWDKRKMTDNIVDSGGDRFADVVENAKLSESISHVMRYVKEIADNDFVDGEAQTCLKMLKAMQVNVTDCIGDAIS